MWLANPCEWCCQRTAVGERAPNHVFFQSLGAGSQLPDRPCTAAVCPLPDMRTTPSKYPLVQALTLIDAGAPVVRPWGHGVQSGLNKLRRVAPSE